jgi:4-hydroxybenzoate polyprenyltransferase
LGGGGTLGRWLLVTTATTCLYLGGMFLNDAADVDFDRNRCRQRPIPAGQIGLRPVLVLGVLALTAGVGVFVLLGRTSGALAVLLAMLIVVYDIVHKVFNPAPVLLALCRFLVYLVVGSTARFGIDGLLLWCALAMGCYVLGLSGLARTETTPGAWSWAWLVPLPVPAALALVANGGEALLPAAVLVLIFVLWLLRCVRRLRVQGGTGAAVSGLLAGIVWVDLLALAGWSPAVAGLLVCLFVLALWLQKLVPAT